MTETPNQRLITAAPELLAALRLTTEYIEQLVPASPRFPSAFSLSVDADVRRMVLTKAHTALLAAREQEQ